MLQYFIKKRIFSLFLVSVMLVGVSLFFVGCTTDKRVYAATIAPDDVVQMTLFTHNGKSEAKFALMNLGHAFVSFENIGSEAQTIGQWTLAPGETVVVGTWSVRAHFGVWYNLESSYINGYNKYDGRTSVTIGLAAEDLVTVNEFIAATDKWTFFYNCSHFALDLYNEVADANEKIPAPLIYTPSYLHKYISKFPTHEVNRPINDATEFGYFQDGTFVNFHFEGGRI